MTTDARGPRSSDEPAAREDRIIGMLLGGALGDAVGAPFEGRARVPEAELRRILGSDAVLRWTDDTALQVALAMHLADVAEEHLQDDGMALALARAWEREPWRGYGSNPPRIFAGVLAGKDWRVLAQRSFGGSGSLGNGGAMRAAPVGALRSQPGGIAEVARRSAAVTHAHPVGRDGAVVIALAVHSLLHTRRDDTPAVESVLRDCAAQLSTARFRDALAAAEAASHLDDPQAAACVTGNGIAADEAVAAALCAALPRLADPLSAVTFGVRMGGDTDTIAAMAGSLAGAYAGAAALPEDLLGRLEARDDITDVARRLATRTARKAPA